MTFPEDYQAEDLKGKDAVFKCTIHEIKAKELPEIDDEFAAEVSEFDTLEEYKADVEAKLREQKAADGKTKQEDQAVEQAVENAQYELPEAMIETQVSQMAEDFSRRIKGQGLTMEQYFQFTGLKAERFMEDLRTQMYRMDADKMKETMGDKEKARMKEDIAVQEAITFLVENAVEK